MEIIIFAAIPVTCGNRCHCHYSVSLDYNIYNCSSISSTTLPNDTDNLTQVIDYMDFSNNDIVQLCREEKYLRNVRSLDLSYNKISLICEHTLVYLQKAKIEILHLDHNNFSALSSNIMNIKSLQSITLSANRFICNCYMTWMIDWFSSRTSSGKRVVQDYDQVVCSNGKMFGKLIHKLTLEEMGCYPHVLSLGQKLTIGILGSLIIAIVIAIIAISRRWNEVKRFLFLHFDILDKSDRNEYLDGKTYDAFLSYR